MKTKIALLTLGTATALLSSCVETYTPASGAVVTATTYQPGYVVHTLPTGYRTEVVSGTRYYSHDNVYYRPQGSSYVVVKPPHPGDAGWDGKPRGYDNDWDGVDRDGDGRDRDDFQHEGHVTVIRTLPSGYVVVNRGGQRYYRAGNVYYQARSGGYVVVERPF
ncbi:hypothetical protein [Haloferula sp. BvORR071]|uniref:hypothetical protein n=1 Tax=Haloferula sp. BvORR071 TaxID=1396141 RepID=UPI000552171E|nr:hypothetical protein [Haloferula sp. BvORR071]